MNNLLFSFGFASDNLLVSIYKMEMLLFVDFFLICVCHTVDGLLLDPLEH